eukprot:2013629-Pyramimonas_sp.AAC.1
MVTANVLSQHRRPSAPGASRSSPNPARPLKTPSPVARGERQRRQPWQRPVHPRFTGAIDGRRETRGPVVAAVIDHSRRRCATDGSWAAS